jgi:hypothetical protein
MKQQECQTCYIYKIEITLGKNDKLLVLFKLNITKLVCDICVPFQWCPLYCMVIKNVLFH